MQQTTPAGLKPATRNQRRCAIACIHNATEGAEDVKLTNMWAARTPAEAHGVLSAPDVVVTNQSDKEIQLAKIAVLNDDVRAAFDARSAARLRTEGVPAGELRRGGFELSTLVTSGYTVAELRGTGCNVAEVVAAGVTAARTLREGGYLPRELAAAGMALLEAYTAEELSTIQEAGAVEGGLYAVGGYGDGRFLSSVERYDAGADAWTAVASMGSQRSGVGVASLGGQASGPLTLKELRAAGCTAEQLLAAGRTT